MEINNVYCLFEQSGTFKNEFKKLGINAFDFDILNNFNETDYVIDLFQEIENCYAGGASIFDNFHEEDLIFAFFFFVRFAKRISLYFTGKAYAAKKWSDEQKLNYAMNLHDELHRNYCLLSKLCLIALQRKLRLIIENPYNEQHYLVRYFPLQPKIIDLDRRNWGDYFEKPTQFYFINCNPENNLIMDEGLDYIPKKLVDSCSYSKGERSWIHPQYARRFIRTYILK